MLTLIGRDVRLALRAGGGALTGLLFFLAVVVLIPFAIGPDLPLIERIGPAILWLGALLASLLGLDRIFVPDRSDGSIDLFATAPMGLEWVAMAKLAAYWLTTGLPLVVASLPLGALTGLTGRATAGTATALLVGTPALAALGTIGAAVAVSLPRGGLLTAVLVMPFAVPTLIFGTATAGLVAHEGWGEAGNALAILAAISLVSLAITPFAVAAALRSDLD